MAIDLGRSDPARRLSEIKSNIKKSFSDFGSGVSDIGFKLGYYDKVAETLAAVNASKVMLENTKGKFSSRINWMKILLGAKGVQNPSGIEQALKNDDFKFDTKSIENALKDIEAQEAQVAKLKLFDDNDPKKKELSGDEKKEVEARIKEYKSTLSGLKDYKGRRYTTQEDKLEPIMESILTDKNQNKAKLGKLKEIRNALKQKKEDEKNAATLKKDYENAVYILGLVKEDAESFIDNFEGRHGSAAQKFSQKIDKIIETIDAYIKSYSESLSKKLKKRAGTSVTGKKALLAAAKELADELGLDSDTKTFNQSLDTFVKAAETAHRLFVTQSTSQIAGYKRATEQLIDAFIDFHRFVEKNCTARDSVINDRSKGVILKIRKENRTYFLKEAIDENTELTKELEELATKKTAELER